MKVQRLIALCLSLLMLVSCASLVACDTADKAAVYAEDSADADVLGGLANGTKVEVIQTMDGWSHIRLQGHEGYMREQDLKFLVEGMDV